MKQNGKIDWDISIERLMKRDKGICYLCNESVDIKLDPNHDYYPSIEHVIPVAKGGTHSWDNVKLAHRKCNYLKSDEVI
ncbi:HNH endonuclease [Priestia flexa]|uniref:HNH endonuclease n=1 Tax=Priestia flexa TaxID=86664 RepID=UPI0012947BAE|nr:HNH endonuclease [Priestia flexa]